MSDPLEIVPSVSSDLLVPLNIVSSVSSNVQADLPFTPRLQIITGTSQVVKNWKKEEGPAPEDGVFWLGPPGGKNLGRKFLAVPLALRDHALQTKKSNVSKESYLSADKGSPPKNLDEKIFAEIMALPKQQPKEGIFNWWGVDALLWLPNQRLDNGDAISTGVFAVYFLHSTARPEKNNCVANRGKLCYVRSHENHSTSFTWSTPEIGPMNGDGRFDPVEFPLPSKCEIEMEVTKFLNPSPKGEGRENSDGVGGAPR